MKESKLVFDQSWAQVLEPWFTKVTSGTFRCTYYVTEKSGPFMKINKIFKDEVDHSIAQVELTGRDNMPLRLLIHRGMGIGIFQGDIVQPLEDGSILIESKEVAREYDGPRGFLVITQKLPLQSLTGEEICKIRDAKDAANAEFEETLQMRSR